MDKLCRPGPFCMTWPNYYLNNLVIIFVSKAVDNMITKQGSL